MQNKLSNKNHIIIYSHGFGVRKDDRGLLSDIAASLPEVESILFDYFDINEKDKTITIRPFSTQIKMLNKAIEEARLANPNAIIDLICHSQGTIVAALAKPDKIRKTILLAPVFDMSLKRTITRYHSNPQTQIDLDGISTLPPVDGLTRIVPAQYWLERQKLKTFEEYNSFAAKTEMIVIQANQDEILPKVDLKELSPNIKLMTLDGNHGFHIPDRVGLLAVIKELLK